MTGKCSAAARRDPAAMGEAERVGAHTSSASTRSGGQRTKRRLEIGGAARSRGTMVMPSLVAAASVCASWRCGMAQETPPG